MSRKLTQVDQQAIERLQSLIQIPSVTGNEHALARHLLESLQQLGASHSEIVEDQTGRPNVVAVFPSQLGAPSDELVLVAHMDTVTIKGWSEWWSENEPDDERQDPYSAAIAQGAIWGRGAADVKGGIATILSSIARAVSSGKLNKNLIVAFVSDEESGEVGFGTSSGIKSLLPRIQELSHESKLAIYVEPTKLAVYTSQIGFIIADITVLGKSAYFGTPDQGLDSLRIMHQVLSSLWNLDSTLALQEHDRVLGAANLLITSIQGGGPIAVPGKCTVSLIRKVLPGESMTSAQHEIEEVLALVAIPDGATIEVNFPAGRDHSAGGTPLRNDETIEGISEFVSHVERNRLGQINVGGAPYWSEAPLIEEAIGCPCVYWAAGDIAVCHTPNEHLDIGEFLEAIEILTEFIGTPWITKK